MAQKTLVYISILGYKKGNLKLVFEFVFCCALHHGPWLFHSKQTKWQTDCKVVKTSLPLFQQSFVFTLVKMMSVCVQSTSYATAPF